MDNIPENTSTPEVYIDFSDKDSNKWKVNINLLINNTLIEERKNIAKNTTKAKNSTEKSNKKHVIKATKKKIPVKKK